MEIDAQISDVCRNLSKRGSLLGDAEYLRDLAAKITPQEAVTLYAYLRDDSGRFEIEWRSEFIQLFPESEPLLPEVDEASLWEEQVFRLVRENNLEGLKAFLEEIGTPSQSFDPKSIYAECAGMGHRDRLPFVPFDFCPVEGEDENGINPIGFAESLGHDAIAKYLRSVVEELDARFLAAYEQGRQMRLGGNPDFPIGDAEIDAGILSVVGPNWQKVAMVIGRAAKTLIGHLPDGEDAYKVIAQRIEILVETDRLQSQGDLSKWRFSEVRQA